MNATLTPFIRRVTAQRMKGWLGPPKLEVGQEPRAGRVGVRPSEETPTIFKPRCRDCVLRFMLKEISTLLVLRSVSRALVVEQIVVHPTIGCVSPEVLV